MVLFLAGESAKSRGMSIEKKIEFLESLTGKVIIFLCLVCVCGENSIYWDFCCLFVRIISLNFELWLNELDKLCGKDSNLLYFSSDYTLKIEVVYVNGIRATYMTLCLVLMFWAVIVYFFMDMKYVKHNRNFGICCCCCIILWQLLLQNFDNMFFRWG